MKRSLNVISRRLLSLDLGPAPLPTGCRPATKLRGRLAAPRPDCPAENPRHSLDLKLVEITEQKIETTIPLSLRVYENHEDKHPPLSLIIALSLSAFATIAANKPTQATPRRGE
ncbi:MAG: hypothetical protein QM813_08310 [Verrucomicrobiota bacterium]